MDTIAIFLAIAALVPVVFRVVRDFLAGRRIEAGRSLRIEVDGHTLELTAVDDEKQQQLVEQWLKQLSEEES